MEQILQQLESVDTTPTVTPTTTATAPTITASRRESGYSAVGGGAAKWPLHPHKWHSSVEAPLDSDTLENERETLRDPLQGNLEKKKRDTRCGNRERETRRGQDEDAADGQAFQDVDGKGQVFASATAATPLQQLQLAPSDGEVLASSNTCTCSLRAAGPLANAHDETESVGQTKIKTHTHTSAQADLDLKDMKFCRRCAKGTLRFFFFKFCRRCAKGTLCIRYLFHDTRRYHTYKIMPPILYRTLQQASLQQLQPTPSDPATNTAWKTADNQNKVALKI